MVFTAISNIYFSYIVAASAPIHAFQKFLFPVLCIIFFPSQCLLPYMIETMVSGERGINPATISVTNLVTELLTPCSQVIHTTNLANLAWKCSMGTQSITLQNQSAENADVAFVKGANERNEFFEKINRQLYKKQVRMNKTKD